MFHTTKHTNKHTYEYKQTRPPTPRRKQGPISCNKLRKSLRAKLEVAHAAKKPDVKWTDDDEASKRLLLKHVTVFFFSLCEKQKSLRNAGRPQTKTLSNLCLSPEIVRAIRIFTASPKCIASLTQGRREKRMMGKVRWPGRSTKRKKQKEKFI